MIKNYNINFDVNKFLKEIRLKKQYVKNLQTNIGFLYKIKDRNYKLLDSALCPNPVNKTSVNDNLITYIIDISFSRSNTLLHVSDFSGKMKFFCSSGSVNYSGKSKKSRYTVFRDLYKLLISELKFLKGNPVALHLKNVGSNKFWIIKRLKKSFFIKSIKSFDLYPYNGCRKRKMRRKKFKKRK